MKKEEELFSKISEIKIILNEKINTIEDFNLNKNSIISLLNQIEIFLKKIFQEEENNQLNKVINSELKISQDNNNKLKFDLNNNNEEDKIKILNIQDISNIDNKSSIINEETELNKLKSNKKNSKALRIADIIMKLNSNDILYDIITQLYNKDILEELMSPNVDIDLINILEKTIEKIIILENEEINKLKNKESSLSLLNNINKNKKIKKIKSYKKYNNIPKKRKTFLGYYKYKIEKSRDFNFENSLRSIDNYNYNKNFKYTRNIFNNYTCPFGNYFDSSLQKGGESKLLLPNKNKIKKCYKSCRSPVKDYING